MAGMAREKDGYRDNLELLNVRFPDHDMLTIEEVMLVTGYTSRNSIAKYLGQWIVNKRMSKVYLARYMCGGS
jgi:hypothetical protein